MVQKSKRGASINSVSLSSSIATMRLSSWKSFLHQLFSSAKYCRGKQDSCSPRTLKSDVESEEVQDSTTFCFSSYYSVFVVRLSIMVLLAILIGMLTLLTWHFTRIYTARSLETLAYGLRHEMLQRPILRMWNILNSTVEITTAQVKLSESIIRRYSQPVNQAQQVQLYDLMRDVTWALFASRRALNSITINYKNGFVQAFHRDHWNNNTYYIYSDLFNYSISGSYHATVQPLNEAWSDQSIHNNISALWYQEPLDPETGEKIGKPRPIAPDELINIAGISQIPDGTASWHVAVSKYTDSPLLSAALPVRDSPNGSIVAVVGVTTSFYSVGLLMKELVEFYSGHIYLTTQEGWLLATSTNTSLLMNSSTGPKLMMAIDSEDHVISSGAEYLIKADDRRSPSSHEVHIENARLGRQSYYIDSFFLNLKRLPMVGVVIIPRKYIMGKVDERALKTLVVLISASVCILVIGCVCIFVLTNGVSKEMQLRAELISHLDARRQAEASSNYKSQFLANMSHELRTPMAAVIGLLDILICDECLSNDQHATVTQIRKCSTALLRLLNNILDLSKVESGKLVLEETEFDLGRELEGLVDMFSVQCINHDVETILDISDDMPEVVQGDSARVVQIFANLISNSIKFTSSGYIIVRGWCEYQNSSIGTRMCSPCQKDHWPTVKVNLNQQEDHDKRCFRKENKIVLCFEVDDSGCGIDPSKRESVFESFEQADPSTTRLHGGTGLGLCIVRTLVNKMGGDIKIVKKNEPGTLMRLFLLLKTPADLHESGWHHNQLKFDDYKLTVLIALSGRMSRLIISKWLQKNGVCTYEASEWNEFVQILQENLPFGFSESEQVHKKGMIFPLFIIVIDIGLLNLSDIWKEQLNYLDEYLGRAKFAWVLNHDTSNTIKTELRRRGHFLMINKPLHKAKILHILEAAVKVQNSELQQYMDTSKGTVIRDLNECQEADDNYSLAAPCHFRGKRYEQFSQSFPSQNRALSNYFVELPPANFAENTCNVENIGQMRDKDALHASTLPAEQKSLWGLRILLAEDTPVLQRVATTMLEKLGAEVVAVGDGLQVLGALNLLFYPNEANITSSCPKKDGNSETVQPTGLLPYDLILMDCQMPLMDGYEATKAIRKSESETGLHIPIVALTAHAMSSDEAKCLEVGMDAYLTKPIDRRLMVYTILSLTKRTT